MHRYRAPVKIIQQYPEKGLERDLALLMQNVGLGDMPLSELGGNHPACHMNESAPVKKVSRKRAPDKAPPQNNNAVQDCADGNDMDPIERARRIEAFIDRHGYNITEAARLLGRSRAYVRNHLRLLDLPPPIQAHLREGRLSEGHARAIAKMCDPEAMARLIIRRQLSVRDAETIARRLRYVGPDGRLLRETAIPNTVFVENFIEDALGFKVRVKDRAGRGQISISYKSPAEFQHIVGRLTRVYDGTGFK